MTSNDRLAEGAAIYKMELRQGLGGRSAPVNPGWQLTAFVADSLQAASNSLAAQLAGRAAWDSLHVLPKTPAQRLQRQQVDGQMASSYVQCCQEACISLIYLTGKQPFALK